MSRCQKVRHRRPTSVSRVQLVPVLGMVGSRPDLCHRHVRRAREHRLDAVVGTGAVEVMRLRCLQAEDAGEDDQTTSVQVTTVTVMVRGTGLAIATMTVGHLCRVETRHLLGVTRLRPDGKGSVRVPRREGGRIHDLGHLRPVVVS